MCLNTYFIVLIGANIHLHDELSSSWHSLFGNEGEHGVLLLLGLLNLDEPRNWINRLAVFWEKEWIVLYPKIMTIQRKQIGKKLENSWIEFST
jgi:hypothetical protein